LDKKNIQYTKMVCSNLSPEDFQNSIPSLRRSLRTLLYSSKHCVTLSPVAFNPDRYARYALPQGSFYRIYHSGSRSSCLVFSRKNRYLQRRHVTNAALSPRLQPNRWWQDSHEDVVPTNTMSADPSQTPHQDGRKGLCIQSHHLRSNLKRHPPENKEGSSTQSRRPP
jgi:hypothetical protein